MKTGWMSERVIGLFEEIKGARCVDKCVDGFEWKFQHN